jgi:hypothetical protein
MPTTAQQIKIETLEDELVAYQDEHYGPMWGHEDEDHCAQLHSQLHAAYDEANVPEYDRRAI